MRTEVAEAAAILARGGLVAIPTETVYGLAADARLEFAVRQIFALKGRPSNHPLIVHVDSLESARAWARSFSPLANRLAQAFWPGPLTLILPRSPLASDAVTGGQDTVGLRVPQHPLTLELLRALKTGLAAPSANRYGRISPTTAEHVRAEFGAALACVLDGGPCAVGVESTIVDVSTDQPRLLRPGGISKEALEAVAQQAIPHVTHATDLRVPGQVQSHYAPTAGLLLLDESALAAEATQRLAQGQRVAVLAREGLAVAQGATSFTVPADAEGFARVLYATLRLADASGAEVILASLPAAEGAGLAVRDRLLRAAAPRPR